MTDKALAQMRQRPGLYIFADDCFPGQTHPVVAIADPARPDEPCRIFNLDPTYEVAASADAWRPTSFLVSGPHSVQEAERQELLEESLRDEIEFWRDLALRGRHAVSFMRDFRAATGDTEAATEMQNVLDRAEHALEAMRRAGEMCEAAKQQQATA